jgi:hypothetical protein
MREDVCAVSEHTRLVTVRSTGDLVTLTRGHPLRDRTWEALVMDRSRREIRLVSDDVPPGLSSGAWRCVCCVRVALCGWGGCGWEWEERGVIQIGQHVCRERGFQHGRRVESFLSKLVLPCCKNG